MKPILIVYATREGHTRKIAEHLGATARSRGLDMHIVDAREQPEPFDPSAFGGAILCASIHIGKHEPEMAAFVKRHKDALEAMRSVFLSVSLAETTAEDPTRPAGDRAKAAAEVDRMIDKFLEETGWQPTKVQAAAGALLYSKYNFLVRFVMRRIAGKAGGPTDTSRDYEFTDWEALDKLIDDVAA